MRLTLALLVATALGVGAETLCNGKAVKVDSIDHVIGGETVQMIQYSCPNGFSADIVQKTAGSNEPTTITEQKTSVEARQDGACATYPPPTCQSKVACTDYHCEDHSLIPNQADCFTIASNLYGARPFLTNPKSYQEMKYRTCVFRWANLSTGVLEYSPYNWADIGVKTFTACTVLKPLTDGYCLSPGSLWYIQVARASTAPPSQV